MTCIGQNVGRNKVNRNVSEARVVLSKDDLSCTIVRQGYRYHKPRQAFSKFYRRHGALVQIYSVGLKKG